MELCFFQLFNWHSSNCHNQLKITNSNYYNKWSYTFFLYYLTETLLIVRITLNWLLQAAIISGATPILQKFCIWRIQYMFCEKCAVKILMFQRISLYFLLNLYFYLNLDTQLKLRCDFSIPYYNLFLFIFGFLGDTIDDHNG